MHGGLAARHTCHDPTCWAGLWWQSGWALHSEWHMGRAGGSGDAAGFCPGLSTRSMCTSSRSGHFLVIPRGALGTNVLERHVLPSPSATGTALWAWKALEKPGPEMSNQAHISVPCPASGAQGSHALSSGPPGRKGMGCSCSPWGAAPEPGLAGDAPSTEEKGTLRGEAGLDRKIPARSWEPGPRCKGPGSAVRPHRAPASWRSLALGHTSCADRVSNATGACLLATWGCAGPAQGSIDRRSTWSQLVMVVPHQRPGPAAWVVLHTARLSPGTAGGRGRMAGGEDGGPLPVSPGMDCDADAPAVHGPGRRRGSWLTHQQEVQSSGGNTGQAPSLGEFPDF